MVDSLDSLVTFSTALFEMVAAEGVWHAEITQGDGERIAAAYRVYREKVEQFNRVTFARGEVLRGKA